MRKKNYKKKDVAIFGKKKDVIDVIMSFSKKKHKIIKDIVKEKEDEIAEDTKYLEEKEKRIKKNIYKKNILKEKRDSFLRDKGDSFKKNLQEAILLIKKTLPVKSIQLYSKKRILITTKMLKVFGFGWKKPRNIGKYQIRIDFSQSFFKDGIKILNITQRFKNHDSPTICDTNPCYGNVSSDIEEEFNSLDLHGLISDLIDYIVSPRTIDGYLGKDGDKTKGWEQFLSSPTKMLKGYSFKDYDKNNNRFPNGRSTETFTVGGLTSEIDLSLIRTTSASTSISTDTLIESYNALTSAIESHHDLSPTTGGNQRSQDRPLVQRIRHKLSQLSFTDNAINYLTHIILNTFNTTLIGNTRYYVRLSVSRQNVLSIFLSPTRPIASYILDTPLTPDVPALGSQVGYNFNFYFNNGDLTGRSRIDLRVLEFYFDYNLNVDYP